MQVELSGDTPKGDVLFCSCDSIYFEEFAKPLAYSANQHGNDLHIHVMEPTEKNKADFILLKDDVSIDLTISEEVGGFNNREYYSCNRFIVAPYLLQQGAERLLIIDTDCLIMDHLDFPEADLGLFLRKPWENHNEWETLASHVAAGMVYYTQTSFSFAAEVSEALTKNKLIWFIDQVALWKTYERDKLTGVRNYVFHKFTEKDMDWEFVEGTKVWTGKGSRKYDNPIYLAEQQKYRDRWKGIEERFWE
jgi:hypothetical protein